MGACCAMHWIFGNGRVQAQFACPQDAWVHPRQGYSSRAIKAANGLTSPPGWHADDGRHRAGEAATSSDSAAA